MKAQVGHATVTTQVGQNFPIGVGLNMEGIN